MCLLFSLKSRNCFARYFNYVDFVFYASFVVLCSLYLHKALDIVRSVNNLVDDLGCPIVNISDDIDYSLWWDKVWFYEVSEILSKILALNVDYTHQLSCPYTYIFDLEYE